MRAVLLLAFVHVVVLDGANLNPENAYRVTPMKNQPGLYYERVTTLRLQQADWRVTTFIDMVKFLNDLPREAERLTGLLVKCSFTAGKVFPGMRDTRDKCRELLNIEYIENRVMQARVLADELFSISRNSPLKKVFAEPSLRTMDRRSVPLGFIGSLSKSLFGTMNEEDAEYKKSAN